MHAIGGKRKNNNCSYLEHYVGVVMHNESSQVRGDSSPPTYFKRIQRLKNRVITTRPEMDLENAALLTRDFIETAGEPLVVRKAKAFRRQCQEKSVFLSRNDVFSASVGNILRRVPCKIFNTIASLICC